MDEQRARKNEAFILQRLAQVGQATVAAAIGVSEATMSRIKNEEVGRLARMLAALDAKCVPTSHLCYRPQTISAIFHLAQERLNEIKTPESLAWDE